MTAPTPMDEFERSFAESGDSARFPDRAHPVGPRNRRARRIALAFLFACGGLFLIEIAWMILSRHDLVLLRVLSLVAGFVGLFLWMQFPVKRIRDTDLRVHREADPDDPLN